MVTGAVPLTRAAPAFYLRCTEKIVSAEDLLNTAKLTNLL